MIYYFLDFLALDFLALDFLVLDFLDLRLTPGAPGMCEAFAFSCITCWGSVPLFPDKNSAITEAGPFGKCGVF